MRDMAVCLAIPSHIAARGCPWSAGAAAFDDGGVAAAADVERMAGS